MEEAARHPHMLARQTYVEIDGVVQPAPAPRFSRSTPQTPHPPLAATPEGAEDVLNAWLGKERVAALRKTGTLP